MADNEKQDHAEKKNCNEINAGKACIDGKGHDKRTDHTRRSTHHHAEHHLVSVLNVGYIGGQTCDKTCRAEFINIRKGKGLNMIEHASAEISGKSGRSFCPVSSAGHAGKQSDGGCDDHQSADAVDVSEITGIYALIDDRGHQIGNHGLHQHLQQHKERSCDGSSFVFPYFF